MKDRPIIRKRIQALQKIQAKGWGLESIVAEEVVRHLQWATEDVPEGQSPRESIEWCARDIEDWFFYRP